MIQSALRSNWKASPFLRVSALDPERLKEETRRLAEFPDGFVSTSIHFTKFTNIAGFRLPRMAGLWLIWLCAVIAIYRAGVMLFSPRSSCHCLGVLGTLVGSAGRNENAITFVIWLGLTGMALTLLALGHHSKRALARAPYPLVLISLVVGLASLPSGNACAAIQISGEIAADYYSPQGHPINHGLSKFRVVRDGSRWQLITEQAGSESLSITSDGNTTFTVISATNTAPVRVARGATNVNARMQVGIIDPWSFPLHTPAASLPWWFFVLSRETDLRLSDLPAPWSNPRSDPKAYFCSNVVTWSGAHPGVVASAAFFYSADILCSWPCRWPTRCRSLACSCSTG